MITHGTPTESTLFIESLVRCGLDEMIGSFRSGMPSDHLDSVNIMMVVNSAMVLADIDINARARALGYMQAWLEGIRAETGKPVSSGWVCADEDAAK